MLKGDGVAACNCLLKGRGGDIGAHEFPVLTSSDGVGVNKAPTAFYSFIMSIWWMSAMLYLKGGVRGRKLVVFSGGGQYYLHDW